MSIRASYQRCCDRCGVEVGDPLDDRPYDDDDPSAPILTVEAVSIGIHLKVLKDLCPSCEQILPGLVEQIVSGKKPPKPIKKAK